MELLKLRKWDDLEDVFVFLVDSLARIVEEESGFEDLTKTTHSAPDLGFQFQDREGEFEVYCSFKIRNDYMKIRISGIDAKGNPFTDKVNMFFKDSLLLIGQRISSSILSYPSP